MAFSKVYDLAYEVDGNSIQLEQDSGCGEVDRITLHPMHLRLLATEAGLLRGDVDAWSRVATLERRLLSLRSRIEALDDHLRSVPVFPPGARDDDPELMLSAFALELADEYCADLASVVSEHAAAAIEAPTNAEPQAQPKRQQAQQVGLPLEGRQ